MITNIQERTQNHYIQSLKESLASRNLESAECLLLIHQDEVLLDRMGPVMQCLDTLVLQIPQGEWQFGESHLATAISWAIQESGIRSLYVCGHSFATSDDPTERSSTLSEGEYDHDENSDRLWMLGRLLDNQDRLQRAKTYFANQIDLLIDLPPVQTAIHNAEIRLRALFFLAQAGAFMSYNPNTQDYQPLIPDENRM